MGKRASGEGRPSTVVIREPDGPCEIHELDEQQLLDFFTCGAPMEYREATLADAAHERPRYHNTWKEVNAELYEAANEEEREKLFRLERKKRTNEIVGYFRLHIPTASVALNPATDIVGVANGGLGYQVMDILLGRYPEMDIRVIGSGTLKENRKVLDELLPKKIQREAAKVRAVVEAGESETDEEEAPESRKISKSAAKDANAKFDAHRIAFALADEAKSRLFHRCTLRDRDWAETNLAYGQLEEARKARVAAEQQFRQIHRTELRRLIKDQRIAHVTLAVDEGRGIDKLLADYGGALLSCGYGQKRIMQKMDVLTQAYARITGARIVEEQMEESLELALRQLPEYTEFLAHAKASVDTESKLPLGKYIGERIFGRWIAGFGTPMASRLDPPIRADDAVRLAACRESLSATIVSFTHREGLPAQPPQGGGKTREWLLACRRLATTDLQIAEVEACLTAYHALQNAKKRSKNRPLNRVIAFMGLHVRHGGKYASTPKDHEFPRRRKGGRANWNESLLRQGAYQWVTLIIKGGDSYWKHHVYQPYKDMLIAGGMSKGHAHKRAFWRTATVAVRWLINEWFSWERRRKTVNQTDRVAA